MNLDELDWDALERLRGIFLEGKPVRTAYWRSSRDLASYNATYAERIGWKWDAVLRGLAGQGNGGWRPPRGPLLDFGCGSGVAGRRVLAGFGPSAFSALHLHDKSGLAEGFSEGEARREFPGLKVETGAPESAFASGAPVTLVVSHVLNELPSQDLRRLMALAEQATAILWVEPGTFQAGQLLVSVRETLRTGFKVIRPCPHSDRCGLLAAGREKDWCHHFAPPPPGLSMDSSWVRFARQAGIDLRSLPYSHLVLERGTGGVGPGHTEDQRVIGRPKSFKGYLDLLSCSRAGVAELRLQRRDAPELADALESARDAILGRWDVLEGRVTGGTLSEPIR
jgi:hypothetical protein